MQQIHENEYAALKRMADAARLRRELLAAGKTASAIDQIFEIDRALDAYDHAVAMNKLAARAGVVPPTAGASELRR